MSKKNTLIPNIQRIVLGSIIVLALVQIGAAATIQVAASNAPSSEISSAQYVCDGSNDQIEIVNAMNAAVAGDTVVLSSGTFNCGSTFAVKNGITFKGQGEDSTILNLAGSRLRIGSNTIASDFQITGSGYLMILGSNNRLENVKAYNLNNACYPSIMIYIENGVIENIDFINCKCIDCDRWGFVNDGPHNAGRLIKNIRYINCQAINCGRYAHTVQGYDVGFSPTENVDGQDILLEGCVASGTWQSGFHFEAQCNKENVTLRNCHAEDNGYALENGFGGDIYCAGYYVMKGVTLENCTSADNEWGYRLYLGDQDQTAAPMELVGCSDVGSDCALQTVGSAVSTDGDAIVRSFSATDSGKPVEIINKGPNSDLLLEGIHIESSSDSENDGIYVSSGSTNADKIIVKDSRIVNYCTGIRNEAGDGSIVNVDAVDVNSSVDAFINCKI
jgi:hypothetical protein